MGTTRLRNAIDSEKYHVDTCIATLEDRALKRESQNSKPPELFEVEREFAMVANGE